MKYTCKNCCNIFSNDKECPVCGKNEIWPIIINIQVQTSQAVASEKQ